MNQFRFLYREQTRKLKQISVQVLPVTRDKNYTSFTTNHERTLSN